MKEVKDWNGNSLRVGSRVAQHRAEGLTIGTIVAISESESEIEIRREITPGKHANYWYYARIVDGMAHVRLACIRCSRKTSEICRTTGKHLSPA